MLITRCYFGPVCCHHGQQLFFSLKYIFLSNEDVCGYGSGLINIDVIVWPCHTVIMTIVVHDMLFLSLNHNTLTLSIKSEDKESSGCCG